MKARIVTSLMVFLLASSSAFGAFVHPGVFTSKAQLEYVKKQIAAGKEPWKSAYGKLVASNPTTRVPKPYVILPGSSDPDDRDTMDQMTLDGSYAYASALLFHFTGEKKYADHAIRILNAWNIYEKGGMPLYSTWAVPHFVNAAELMKHTPGSGWSKTDIDKFAGMLRDHMWSRVQPPEVTYGSNHGTTANESQFAIAVFLDDQAKFDEAVANYKWVSPRYVYLGNSARLDGQCHETCRDLNHTKLGMLGMMYAANTAWIQGVDLWKLDAVRYEKFAELHAGMMTGRMQVPSTLCKEAGADRAGVVYCAGAVSWSDPTKSGQPPNCSETGWEILRNHVATRLGKKLPFTEEMTLRNRPQGGVTTRNGKWETLLHADLDPAAIPATTTGLEPSRMGMPLGEARVVVFDISGRQLLEYSEGSFSGAIREDKARFLREGVYVLRALVGGTTHSARVGFMRR